MVKGVVKGFAYTIGRIIAILFIGFVIATIVSKLDNKEINFKELIMGLVFVNADAMTVNNGYGCLYYNLQDTNQKACYQLTYSNYPNGMSGYGLAMSDFSIGSNNGMVIMDYYNVSFCNNSTGTFTGNILFTNSTFARYAEPMIRIGTNVINCSFSQSGNYSIAFTCASNGFNNQTLSISVKNTAVLYGSSMRVGVSSDIVESCGINANEIIVNNSQNTQNIINNQNQNTQEIIGTLDEINDSLNDDSIDNHSAQDFLDTMEDLKYSDTPITDLILAFPRLITKFITGIDGTCETISIGTWYDHTLRVPCFDLEQYLGSTIYTMIDLFMSFGLFMPLIRLFINDFMKFARLSTGGDVFG